MDLSRLFTSPQETAFEEDWKKKKLMDLLRYLQTQQSQSDSTYRDSTMMFPQTPRMNWDQQMRMRQPERTNSPMRYLQEDNIPSWAYPRKTKL